MRTDHVYIWSLVVVSVGFCIILKYFSLIWSRHHYYERLFSVNYPRQLWRLGSEGSLTWHTCNEEWHPVFLFILENPSHLLSSVCQWSCHYLLWRHWSVTAGLKTPKLPLEWQRYYWIHRRSGMWMVEKLHIFLRQFCLCASHYSVTMERRKFLSLANMRRLINCSWIV